jgi:hypothetical protein
MFSTPAARIGYVVGTHGDEDDLLPLALIPTAAVPLTIALRVVS